MRRKKHKHVRRVVGFYRVRFGFRTPFKVLLDGNFVHATFNANLKALHEHIPKLLGAPCRLYTTKCVGHELLGLGKDYQKSAAAARSYHLHKCGHETHVPAAECLMQQIGNGNHDHWWVATQDAHLREKLAKVAGVPVLFASVNGLHVETPSDLTASKAQEASATARSVPEHEKRSEALAVLAQQRTRQVSTVKFRRKKAKGPNPLAVKKKKKTKATGAAPATAPGARRKRARTKRGAGAAGPTEGTTHE